MPYEAILFDVADGVATITLNRPDKLNAWTPTMGVELSDAMAACDEDDEIRAVVLTGAGRAFCAGADMGAGASTFSGQADAAGAPPPRRPGPEVFPWEIRKPVIAAINGHAIGVGITYPLQADIRLVAEDAKIAFAFVRRGVLPELGSHAILARVLGLSRAAELLLTGRTITGHEAADLGLASRALPAEEVLPAALDLAREIAVNTAPVSVAVSKRLLWEGGSLPVEEVRRREHTIFGWLGRQADAAEGVTAFLEKRDPKWSLSPTADFPEWPA